MRRSFKSFASSFTTVIRQSTSLSEAPRTLACLSMASSSSARDFQSQPSNGAPPVGSVETIESRVQFSPVEYLGHANNRHETLSVNPGSLPRNRTQTVGRQSLHPAPTGGLSGAHPRRPSSINTIGGTLKRKITKSETIRAYNVPTGTNWEPGAEPGIDTRKDQGEHHGLHQVSYSTHMSEAARRVICAMWTTYHGNILCCVFNDILVEMSLCYQRLLLAQDN